MNTYEVPYSDLLIRLALYQKDLDLPVRFSFQLVAARDQAGQNYLPEGLALVLVRPIFDRAQAVPAETLPLFNFPELDPLRLWEHFGLIQIINGKLERGRGEFVLTPKTFDIDLIRSGGI